MFLQCVHVYDMTVANCIRYPNFGIACQSEFTVLSNYRIDDFRRSFDLYVASFYLSTVSNETRFNHQF